MAKQKTSKSLGSLTDYVSPNPTPPESETLFVLVGNLERRVTVLEGLLNDVMHQIDKPVRDQKFGKGSQGEPKATGAQVTKME